ncbi:MAG: GrpB family protein [Clostridia bacterium]|nr:GrpB family protein [Clostridia bacterium]
MGKSLSEMTLEELWQLFPIILTKPDPRWRQWYAQEHALIEPLLPAGTRISHIGSTAIEGIWAKPIVDLLAELPPGGNPAAAAEKAAQASYRIMSRNGSRISCNKGYTESGFAERVFHLHLRMAGDHDELYFRDYLNDHPSIAAEYEQLKLSLWKAYEHDRDGYTAAKAAFVAQYTGEAKGLYGSRYEADALWKSSLRQG